MREHPAPRPTVRAKRSLAVTSGALLALLALPPHAASQPAPPAPVESRRPLSDENWRLFQKVLGLVLEDYVDPKTPAQVIRGALQGAASAAGPESAYIPPEEVVAFRAAEEAPFNLPLYLTKGEDFARIICPYPGLEKGPASGDSLKSVEGTSTYDLTYPEVLALASGAEGAKAACIFLKRDVFETYRLTLPFLPLPAPRWVARPKGGVLVLPSLPASLPESVLKGLSGSGGASVLVDLRSCAQGDARKALRTAGLLLGSSPGPKSRGQRGETAHALSGEGLLKGRKIRVLVGPDTARGGEVLARALEVGGAVLVGAETAGWAPLAEVFPLENGGLLRMNTAFFLDRDGKPIQREGIRPTAPIEARESEAAEALYDRALVAEPPAPEAKAPGGPAPEKGSGG